MSDLDVFKAMLDRAGIPYTHEKVENVAETGHSPALPAGSQMVTVAANWSYDNDGGAEQPLPGGYSGFFTEIIFGPDGALLAVWAWE